MRVTIPAAGVLLLGCGVAGTWKKQSPLNNDMAYFERDLSAVLRLTNPGDLVMDGKGETIFRNRPIYWVLEGVTLRRIQMGLIPNDVKQKIIDTGTCVAVNHRLRPEDRVWLRANFIEGDGKVWIAGEDLGPARPTINFHTDIKAKYSIVSETGKLAGALDGAPLLESQEVAPGDHQLRITAGTGDVALVWTQALERGLNPFTKRIAGISQ